jgi:hypothetical protein
MKTTLAALVLILGMVTAASGIEPSRHTRHSTFRRTIRTMEWFEEARYEGIHLKFQWTAPWPYRLLPRIEAQVKISWQPFGERPKPGFQSRALKYRR